METPSTAATKIEISLNRLTQLFNSFDPSPFRERDLDREAEDYIVGSAEEASQQRPLALVIHLPADQMPASGLPDLREAIHNYFAYRPRPGESAVAAVIPRRPFGVDDWSGVFVLLHAVARIGVFPRQ